MIIWLNIHRKNYEALVYQFTLAYNTSLLILFFFLSRVSWCFGLLVVIPFVIIIPWSLNTRKPNLNSHSLCLYDQSNSGCLVYFWSLRAVNNVLVEWNLSKVYVSVCQYQYLHEGVNFHSQYYNHLQTHPQIPFNDG